MLAVAGAFSSASMRRRRGGVGENAFVPRGDKRCAENVGKVVFLLSLKHETRVFLEERSGLPVCLRAGRAQRWRARGSALPDGGEP